MLQLNVARAVDFQGLGDLPGGEYFSEATSVSPDGSIVVGYSSSLFGSEAFIWSAAHGMQGLGDLDDGLFESIALATSRNGSAVVGQANSSSGQEAFLWTPTDGMVGLGDLEGGAFESIANDVSFDGNVIAGTGVGSDGFKHAIRWKANSEQGPVEIGSTNTEAFGVAGDGSTLVGSYLSSLLFQWSEDTGENIFPPTPGAKVQGAASFDGSVTVGHAFSLVGFKPFRWSEVNGVMTLVEAGNEFAAAQDVSADGEVVVGNIDFEDDVFIWTQRFGFERLGQKLMDWGADVEGWTLETASGISADGTVVVGMGINPNGHCEAWKAEIPIPEPSSGIIFLLGVAAVSLLSRRLELSLL